MWAAPPGGGGGAGRRGPNQMQIQVLPALLTHTFQSRRVYYDASRLSQDIVLLDTKCLISYIMLFLNAGNHRWAVGSEAMLMGWQSRSFDFSLLGQPGKIERGLLKVPSRGAPIRCIELSD
jgi:hypothetical protein